MTEERRHDAFAIAILTSLIALLFADVLLGIHSLYQRDIAFYYYPAKKILREIVLGGEFPFWNPFFSAGQPMAANPEHEVFYPLTWLILLPSYDFGLRLFIVLHLCIAAWTMYAFLRSLDLGPPAACFGAFSFAMGGVTLSYLNLLPILIPVAWLPATCLFARRFLMRVAAAPAAVSPATRRLEAGVTAGEAPALLRDFALAVFFLALQVVIGEPTTLLQTGLLLGFYTRMRPKLLALVALIVVAAVLLGAVQVLPMLDHARDSVRARGFTFDVSGDWSLPPARLGELFFPNFLGYQMLDGRRVFWGAALYGSREAPFIYSIYPGLLVIVLALAGFFARIRGAGLVLGIVAFSVLLALGSHTPLWRLLYDIGLVRALRYPEKFILMALFVLIVFAARVLEHVLAGDERTRTIALRVLLVTTIVAAVGAVLSSTSFYPSIFAQVWQPGRRLFGEMLQASRTAWIVATLRGVLLFVLLRNFTRVRRTTWLALTALFVLLDLGALLPQLAPRVDSSYFSEPPAIARQLPPNRDAYRLFHHADWHRSRPQVRPYFELEPDLYWIYRNAMFPMLTSAYGVRTAMEIDYDSTSLQCTADFVEAAWALSRYRRDWADVAASMSNVWYRAVYIDPREAFAHARGNRRIVQPVALQPLGPHPRYYFARAMESIRGKDDFVRKLAGAGFIDRTAYVNGEAFTPAPGRVLNVRETANGARIDVESDGRGFLTMSVTPHKYWRITIDGVAVPAIVTNLGYQGVVVPAGRHVVNMRYRNPLIIAGGAISLLTAIALIVIGRKR